MTLANGLDINNLSLISERGFRRVHRVLNDGSDRPVGVLECRSRSSATDVLRLDMWTLAQIAHPALPRIHDIVRTEEGHPFALIEAVTGEPLLSGARGLGDPRHLLRQLCQFLDALHRRGLVAVDLDPAGICLQPGHLLRFTDFGMIQHVGVIPPRTVRQACLAPEIRCGDPAEYHSDLYALGALISQLFKGHPSPAARRPDETERLTVGVPMDETDTSDAGEIWRAIIPGLLDEAPSVRQCAYRSLLSLLDLDIEPSVTLKPGRAWAGRSGIIHQFEEQLQTARHLRTGGRFHIGGPAKVGKSHLLRRLAVLADAAGFVVLNGRGSHSYRPYSAVIHAVQRALEALGTGDAIPSGRTRGYSLSLAPILDGLKLPRGHHWLPPEQERARTLSAAMSCFSDLAMRQGVVLLLDDWQDADEASQDLIAHLSHRATRIPLLVITAGREDTLPTASGLWTVQPFSLAECRAALSAALGAGVPAGFIDALHEQSRGLPGLLWSLLERHYERGDLCLAKAGWGIINPPVARQSEPDHQLHALQVSIQHSLSLGSHEYPLEQVYRLLAEYPIVQVHTAISALIRQRCLAIIGDQLIWQSAGDRHGILDSLSPAERQGHADRLAAAIAPPYSSQPVGAALVEWASYLSQGSAAKEAIPFIVEAARCLGALGMEKMALRLLAIAQFPLPEPRADENETLYHFIFASLHLAHQADDATLALLKAVPEAQSDAALNRYGFEHKLCLARAYSQRGNYRQAREYFAGVEIDARRMECVPIVLQALLGLGDCHLHMEQHELALTVLNEGLTLGRATGNLFVVGQSLFLLGKAHTLNADDDSHDKDTERAIPFLEQAIAVHEATGDALGLIESLCHLGSIQMRTGKLKEAARHFTQAMDIAQSLDERTREIHIQVSLARIALKQGHCLWALEYADVTRELTNNSPETPAGLAALIVCASARQMLGRLEGLSDTVAQLLPAIARLPDALTRRTLVLDLCDMMMTMGLYPEVRTCLASVEASPGDDAVRLAHLRGRLLLEDGQALAALDVLAPALQNAFQRSMSCEGSAILLGMAQAYWQTGRLDEAERHINRAQKIAETHAALPVLTQCHLLRGRLAMALGDTLLAERQFNRAEILAGRLSLPDELAASLHGRSTAEGPTPQSQLLRDRAQELLTRLNDRVDAQWRAAYVAVHGRWEILNGGWPTPAHRPSEDAPLPERMLALQRVVSLQHQELEFIDLVASSHDASFAIEQALTILLELSFAERADFLSLNDQQWRLVHRQNQLTSLEPIDDDWVLYQRFVETALDSQQCQYHEDWLPPGAGDVRTVLVIPVTEGTRHHAILLIGHPENVKALGRHEQQFVNVLARHLGHTLRKIEIQQEWKERSTRLEMLYALTTAVNNAEGTQDVLTLVLRLALEITRAERALVILLNHQNQLTCEAIQPAPLRVGDAVYYSQSICQRVLDSGQALWTDDARGQTELSQQISVQNLNLRTVMCVPLRVKQRKIGVLYVDSRLMLGRFKDQDLTALQTIADQASVAIENARLNEAGNIDPTTGLLVLPIFEQRLKEEFLRCCRYGGQFSVLILIDDHAPDSQDGVHKRQIELANVLKTNLRDHLDLAARASDNHFVVLLPETAAGGAQVCAERIRKAVQDTTASIGIATFESRQDTTANLMQAAFLACQAAQREGGDRVQHIKTIQATAAGSSDG